MLKIPLRPFQNQIVTVTLASQPCRINVYQKATGLFFDLSMAGAAVVTGSLAANRGALVRGAYTGFAGEFAFFDKQGAEPPSYDGLGSRWILVYFEADDFE